MKKATVLKIIVCSVILAIVLSLLLTFTFLDKSELIANAYRAQGMTVCTETLENDWVRAYLDDLPEDQLKKVEDYEILHAYVPDGTNLAYRAIIVVCPSANEAKQFLKSCGHDLYDEMKQNGMIQGNCILFTHHYAIKDVFNDYLLICFLDKITGIFHAA